MSTRNNQNRKRRVQNRKRSLRSSRALITTPADGPGIINVSAGPGSYMLGFPPRILCNLRYHETSGSTSTLGSIATTKYRWNSMFDPQVAVGGHQPLYSDNFAAVYDHYAVVSAVAVVKFVNLSTATLNVGVVTDDDSTTPTTIDALSEQTTGMHTVLPPQSGSLSSRTFTINWSCEKALGIDPFASESYKSATTADPSEQSILSCWGAAPFAPASADFAVDVTFTYHVLYSELSTQAIN